MKDFDQDAALEMLEDAQEHMRQAIESLRCYVELTGDRHTEAYILDHLRIMTSSDHGFMSRDANVGDVIDQLLHQDIEDEEEVYDPMRR